MAQNNSTPHLLSPIAAALGAVLYSGGALGGAYTTYMGTRGRHGSVPVSPAATEESPKSGQCHPLIASARFATESYRNEVSRRLDTARKLVDEALLEWARSQHFERALATAFGADSSTGAAAAALRRGLIAGSGVDLPVTRLAGDSELAPAVGAYSQETDAIYLARGFVEDGTPEAIAKIWLEEIGHALDVRLSDADSAGDEGAIFSRMLLGENMTPGELTVLRGEDDHYYAEIDGQKQSIEAATIVVDSADPGIGDTTLRSAIGQANNNGEADTIVFDSTIFPRDGDTSNNTTIKLTPSYGEFTITSDITIKGDGNDDGIADVTISGDAANNGDDLSNGQVGSGDVRPFRITGGDADATLNGLVVKGGFSDSYGGGVRVENYAQLTLESSEVSNSYAYSGGGIYLRGVNDDTTLRVYNSTVFENAAYGRNGGGIQSGGTLIIENSTIRDNFVVSGARDGGGINQTRDGTYALVKNTSVTGNSVYDYNGDGGGIQCRGGLFNIVSSHIAGNYARENGGGVAAEFRCVPNIIDSTMDNNTAGFGGALNFGAEYLSIIDSTVSNNRAISTYFADGRGGGIAFSRFQLVRGVIANSTISSNYASYPGGGMWVDADGLYLVNATVADNTSNAQSGGVYVSDAGGITIKNSILGNNVAPGSGPDLYRHENGYAAVGYSLVTNLGGGYTNLGGNETYQVPEIAGLADNGGPTMTHAIELSSPGIDSGDNSAALGRSLDESALSLDINGDGDQTDMIDGIEDFLFDQRGDPLWRFLDRDGDGTVTINMGAVEGAPTMDSDNDGIIDRLDRLPNEYSNECYVGTYGRDVTFDGSVLTGTIKTCGAKDSARLSGGATIETGAALEVITPNTKIETGFNVPEGAELIILPMDPDP